MDGQLLHIAFFVVAFVGLWLPVVSGKGGGS